MIRLQYFDGEGWVDAGEFQYEGLAWISLGGDDQGYRTLDPSGRVLTDKFEAFNDQSLPPADTTQNDQ